MLHALSTHQKCIVITFLLGISVITQFYKTITVSSREKVLLIASRPEKGHMVAIWTVKNKRQLDW